MEKDNFNLEEIEWIGNEIFQVNEEAVVRTTVETLQATMGENIDVEATKVIPVEEIHNASEETKVISVEEIHSLTEDVGAAEVDEVPLEQDLESTKVIPVIVPMEETGEPVFPIESEVADDILLTEKEIEELGDLTYHDEDVDRVKENAGPKKHPGQARQDKKGEMAAAGVGKAGSRNIKVQHKQKNAFARFILNLSWVDIVIGITGIVVAVLLVVALVFWNKNQNRVADLGEFVSVGMQLSDLDTIGDVGINRIVSAETSNVSGEQEVTSEETTEEEETGEEEQESVMVSVSFTSIERDLKIKFTDKTTGKLLEGTAFEIEVVTPSNEVLTWIDSDRDGVIYQDNLKAGTYMVTIRSVDDFTFPSEATKVVVKDKITYQAINVLDEIKTESEIDASKEDTENKDNIETENLLADTVKWVASTKTVLSGDDGYVLIEKETITDPATLTVASAGEYWKTATVDKGSVSLEVGANATLQLGITEDYTKYESYAYVWSSSSDAVKVTGNGGSATVTGVKEANDVLITCTVTKVLASTSETPGESTTEIPSESTTETPGESATESPGESSEETSANGNENSETLSEVPGESTSQSASETSESPASEESSVSEARVQTVLSRTAASEQDTYTFKVTVAAKEEEVAYVTGVTLDKKTLEVTMGSTATLKATVAGDDGCDTSVKWSVDKPEVLKVSSTGVITPVAAGTATVTVTTVGKDSAGAVKTATCTVTVKKAVELTLKVNAANATVLVGETYTIVPTVTNYVSDKSVTYNVDKKEIATVDANGVVTGVAKGTAIVTVTTKESGSDNAPIKVTVTITVKDNPKKDTTTLLKDSEGRQIYLKDANGNYVQAKWADYYTAKEFYIQSEPVYKYTGWQTLDGFTYFFDENGKKVTGEQVIAGVKYNFASDGALSMNGGVLGIDVSKWQGTIDWNAVKQSGISFVIIRCGYRGSSTGALVQDPKFQSYISGATNAGLKVGLYFFSQAINEKEAVEEASMAIALAQNYKISYPIFIDTEMTSNGRANNISRETRTAVCRAFCETVKSAGYTPGIYASKSWYENQLDMSSLNGYKIWLAQYASVPTYTGRYDMWQYTDNGKVNGINEDVDLNISYLGY